jgi:hypothetical protein
MDMCEGPTQNGIEQDGSEQSVVIEEDTSFSSTVYYWYPKTRVIIEQVSGWILPG